MLYRLMHIVTIDLGTKSSHRECRSNSSSGKVYALATTFIIKVVASGVLARRAADYVCNVSNYTPSDPAARAVCTISAHFTSSDSQRTKSGFPSSFGQHLIVISAKKFLHSGNVFDMQTQKKLTRRNG